MQTILILGANGFIGKNLIKHLSSEYNILAIDNKIVAAQPNKNVRWLQADCSKVNFINTITVSIEIIINLTYDRINLNNNKKIIHNVILFCKTRNIKRLIHFSTISVYDPEIIGKLDERSSYSSCFDPYSSIKIFQEKQLYKSSKKNSATFITIVQPTIIIGDNGVWTSTILNQLENENILFLPFQGKNKCNAIHIDDIVSVISNLLAVTPDQPIEKIIFSSDEEISWEGIYKYHLKTYSINKNLKIKNLDSKNKFHNNLVFDILYRILYSKSVSFLIILFSPLINHFIKDKKNAPMIGQVFIPNGILKLRYGSKYEACPQKLKTKYHFKPTITFNI